MLRFLCFIFVRELERSSVFPSDDVRQVVDDVKSDESKFRESVLLSLARSPSQLFTTVCACLLRFTR